MRLLTDRLSSFFQEGLAMTYGSTKDNYQASVFNPSNKPRCSLAFSTMCLVFLANCNEEVG